MVKYKDKLIVNPKLEIRKSDIHSYGVFATENISVGDKLEECWYLRVLNEDHVHEPLKSYTFRLKNNVGPEDAYCLLFGYGSIYNKSKDKKIVNAEVLLNNVIDLFVFTAVRNIKKNEEVCIYHNDNT
jgi:SET domain-containing protein|tara:strand:- start:595 stop:978 length:384 start_codon:yes stop_codon:yes gene_type:complete